MGQKIKQLRKVKKISQGKLAKKLSVTQGSVASWELDHFYPNLFNCIVMADFFGVSLDELCCREFKGTNINESTIR